MSGKRYPSHTTGLDDDVLVMTAHHQVSFEVHYFRGKVHVRFGSSCGMQLRLSQAMALRDLLDAGIADARDEYDTSRQLADAEPTDGKAVA